MMVKHAHQDQHRHKVGQRDDEAVEQQAEVVAHWGYSLAWLSMHKAGAAISSANSKSPMSFAWPPRRRAAAVGEKYLRLF